MKIAKLESKLKLYPNMVKNNDEKIIEYLSKL